MRQTSIDAYRDICAKQITADQCKRIMAVIGDRQMTRREIAQESGIETSSVAGRVNGLIEVGLLEECGKRKCRITGRTVNVVKAVEGWE